MGALVSYSVSYEALSAQRTSVHALEEELQLEKAVLAVGESKLEGALRPQKESNRQCVKMTTWRYDSHPTTVITIPDK